MELLEQWIKKYNPQNKQDLFNAKKEIVQEIVLAGLYRGGFFEYAAFYGDTALRILYGLDRYSEDLDFTLYEQNPNFSLGPFLEPIKDEFALLGLTVNIKIKEKKNYSAVQSAFLKETTEWTFIEIANNKSTQLEPAIRIKIEVDRMPPIGFTSETKTLMQPYVFPIRSVVLHDLYAGKMHAALFRKWGNNEKGRDWYDVEWYVKNDVIMNLSYFRSIIIDNQNITEDQILSREDLNKMYLDKVEKLNLEMARIDISRFIERHKSDHWSKDFFRLLLTKIKLSEEMVGP